MTVVGSGEPVPPNTAAPGPATGRRFRPVIQRWSAVATSRLRTLATRLPAMLGVSLVLIGLGASGYSTFVDAPCKEVSVTKLLTDADSERPQVVSVESKTTTTGKEISTTALTSETSTAAGTGDSGLTTTRECAPLPLTSGFPVMSVAAGGLLLLPVLLRAMPPGSSVASPLLTINGSQVLANVRQIVDASAREDG